MKTFKTVKNLSIFDNIQNINIRIPDYLLTRSPLNIQHTRCKYNIDTGGFYQKDRPL